MPRRLACSSPPKTLTSYARAVESVDGRTTIVDFGGVKHETIIDLMEEGTIVPGVYVLVHTSFVIQKLEKAEALETLAIWREVLSALEEPKEEL